MADPNNQTNDVALAWAGFAPFIQAALAMHKSQQHGTMGANFSPLGQHAQTQPQPGAILGPNGAVAGPMAPAANPVPNALPPALQSGVPGPMQGVSLPATPTANSLVGQPNHFITGTPNPFGTQSV